MMQESDLYFRWVSMYMPLRFLESKDIQQYLMDKMDESRVDTNKICFELTPDILFEGKPIHGTNIEHLRNRGFHFMLTNFGNDEYLHQYNIAKSTYIMINRKQLSVHPQLLDEIVSGFRDLYSYFD